MYIPTVSEVQAHRYAKKKMPSLPSLIFSQLMFAPEYRFERFIDSFLLSHTLQITHNNSTIHHKQHQLRIIDHSL